MEKAKITAYQLFVLIFMFELGSSLLLALGIGAKQDAWLAILGGLSGGVFLYYLYFKIYSFYPGLSSVQVLSKIYGKVLGWILVFQFGVYYLYLAARVLRDFGGMLVITAYPETPVFIANAIMILCVAYGVKKGIEVVARTGEIFFVFLYLLAFMGFVLILASKLVELNLLKPVLENGLKPVFKSIAKETLYIPFGEAIVFFTIFPYLRDLKKVKQAGLVAICLSGMNIAIAMVMNITVIGVEVTQRSPFPLYITIQQIQLAHFLERLDVFFMLALIIGGFFKITIYFYAAVITFTELFKIKNYQKVVYPFCLVILCASVMIAANYAEHIDEGIKVVPVLLHFPFQVAVPILTLIVVFVKEKRKKKKLKASAS
ncbi:GerAB/ArcD/ProY family transporter [Heyndrickxia acidiproducens]|uniref:GerAB/ArcD/ProY family transporter n=1 Tax=Heyndrickxia acidiproducens TaxID=1121084 RepID=UPI00036E2C06|nr:GerAB/ArcD/ProY family transporter [Heyndrickxia acidiproducens]